MALSNPIRIDDGIYSSAKAAAPAMDRSAAQQVSHWARIGREIERSREIPHSEIAAVLNGEAHYDDLDDPRAQAIVRASWAEQMKQWRETLDLEAEFIAKGLPYAELDENGEVVVREPADPTSAPGS